MAVSANAAPGTKIIQRGVHRISVVRALDSIAPHSGISGMSAEFGGPIRTTERDSSMLSERTALTMTPRTPSSATRTSDATTCWLRFVAITGRRCGIW